MFGALVLNSLVLVRIIGTSAMPVPEQICYATPAALASMQGDASKRDYAAEGVCAARYLYFITCCESQ